MNYLLTLQDNDVHPNSPYESGSHWNERLVSKIVLIKQDLVAVIGNTVHSFLLLPGGGIESGETIREGALRECQEETGLTPMFTHELGVTEEYRGRNSRHYITHGFIGEVVNEGTPTPTQKERENGQYIKWLPFKEALAQFERQERILKDDGVKFYNTGFNIIRDSFFLHRAAQLLGYN